MARAGIDYSIISPTEALQHLNTKSVESGLSTNEARNRLRKFGPNRIKIKEPWQWLKTIIEPFASWFVAILAISAAISIWINKPLEAVVVLSILLINAIIYYFQHLTTNRVLKELEKQGKLYSTVIRDGKQKQIIVDEIVPGDIVQLKEGIKVPADGRIIQSTHLHMEESVLTGESAPQRKNEIRLVKPKPIYSQSNMVFKGTFVTSGFGEMVVTATAMDTEYGRIAKLSKTKDFSSPLQRKIDKLTKQLIILVLVITFLTFILSLTRGREFIESLQFVLSLAVSAIPEGLPIAVVVVMIYGVRLLAKHKALVRNLSSVETIGEVTLIATDKTGTITKNQLQINDTWIPAKNTDINTVTYKTADHKHGDNIDHLILKKFNPRGGGSFMEGLPFNQDLRVSGAVWKRGDIVTTYIKGAPEAIIDSCKLTIQQTKAIHKQLNIYSKQGFRVLAVAAKNTKITEFTKKNLVKFSFGGLIAFGDELRTQVPHAVQQAHSAGIDVIMLTGDHIETASYFAKLAGIEKYGKTLEGMTVENLDHAQIRKLLVLNHVFGRILPEHKYKIIDSLHKTQITAMTGDGINDVPALRRASVGIAVGSGTDAAKEAADIIIIDDNFATIINAVRQGRTIVANIKKILSYVLATNLAEIFTVVSALVLNIPLPITALQILWINIVTDSFTMIPLGFEKPERDLMQQKPQNPSAPILEKSRLVRMPIMAIVIAATTLIIYILAIPSGLESAQALAFTVLVVAQWANAINSRSDNKSFVLGILHPNPWLLGGIALACIAQLTLIYTPLSKYLSTQGLSLQQWVIVGIAVVIVLLAGDIIKWLIPIKYKTNVKKTSD